MNNIKNDQRRKLIDIKKNRAPKLCEILNLFTISEEAENRELKSINNNYELKRIEYNFIKKTNQNIKLKNNFFHLLKSNDPNYIIKKQNLKETYLVSDENGNFRMTLPKEFYKNLYKNQKLNYNNRIICKFKNENNSKYPNTTKNKRNEFEVLPNLKESNFMKSFNEIFLQDYNNKLESKKKIINYDQDFIENCYSNKKILNFPIEILKNSNDDYERVKLNIYNNKLISNLDRVSSITKTSEKKEKNISFANKLMKDVRNLKLERDNIILKIDMKREINNIFKK